MKQAFTGRFFRLHLQQVFAVKGDRPGSDFIAFTAGQHLGQRAFAGAVRPHDGMHLPGVHRQVNSLQNLVAIHAGMQIFDFEQTHRLSNTPLKTDAEQLLRFHGKLHRQFVKYRLAEAVDDHADGFFLGNSALLQIENLVFADL